jgi:vacuolar-type H+-ATPase subunit H
MKSMEIDNYNEVKPQQSLEMILQLEIEVAEKIAAAKNKSEKKIDSAQEETAGLKSQIIDEARIERDRAIAEGIHVSRAALEQRVKAAAAEAEQFIKTGKQFEDQAADYVLQLILGSSNHREAA